MRRPHLSDVHLSQLAGFLLAAAFLIAAVLCDLVAS